MGVAPATSSARGVVLGRLEKGGAAATTTSAAPASICTPPLAKCTKVTPGPAGLVVVADNWKAKG